MAHSNKELEIMFTNSPLLIVHGCSPDKWVLMVLKAWDEKYLQLMAVFRNMKISMCSAILI